MSPSDTPSRPKATDSTSRTRELMRSNGFRIGIVVLAAAIFFGAWAFAEMGREDASSDQPGIQTTLDDEYERARRLAESGDTDGAIVILERISAEDPGHERAAALLRQLKAADEADTSGDGDTGDPSGSGTSPEDPGGEPGTDEPRDDAAYLAAVGDLDALLPQVISGWQRGTAEKTDVDATVPFMAVSTTGVSRALYTVHDRGSADDAVRFIEDTSKVVYSSDGSPVRVGVVDGYFGTDGSRLATVAFARGRYAFEVVITVSDGEPASAKDAAVALAREFGATR